MHGKKLGIEQAFLYRLVPVVGEIMVSYYPEVLQQKNLLKKLSVQKKNVSMKQSMKVWKS